MKSFYHGCIYITDMQPLIPHIISSPRLYEVQTTGAKAMEDVRVIHLSHPEHELVLRNFKKPYNCDGCKEQGFGPRYRCESRDCDYVLHDTCMFSSQTETHDFYSDCTFEFSYEPKSCRTCCNACGKNINGFVYRCEDKDLDLHPRCLNLKNKMEIDGVKFKVAKAMEDIKVHPGHPEHELVLRNFKKPYNCDGCKEQGFGIRYRCESSDCDYVLHKTCMLSSQTATHDFYSDCTFKFSYEPRRCGTWCNACGKNINGFVYHCEDKDLDLHPCCLKLKNKMVIDGVKFKLNEKVKSKCIWCKSKTLKGKSEGGWSYKSKCNKYHVHVHCITELIHESWKIGDYNDEGTASKLSVLKNPELRLQRRSSRTGGKYWKILKVFMTAVVAILLGDPTVVLTTTLFNLIT